MVMTSEPEHVRRLRGTARCYYFSAFVASEHTANSGTVLDAYKDGVRDMSIDTLHPHYPVSQVCNYQTLVIHAVPIAKSTLPSRQSAS